MQDNFDYDACQEAKLNAYHQKLDTFQIQYEKAALRFDNDPTAVIYRLNEDLGIDTSGMKPQDIIDRYAFVLMDEWKEL